MYGYEKKDSNDRRETKEGSVGLCGKGIYRISGRDGGQGGACSCGGNTREKILYTELELVALDESGAIVGYVMFSGFSIEGRYEGELLLLSPAAVRTDLQRQHISKDMIEYGFQQAEKMGYTAVLVEGNPKNYHARGFRTVADFGIVPGHSVHLPYIECLMVKELRAGALARIKGTVEYDFYEMLG